MADILPFLRGGPSRKKPAGGTPPTATGQIVIFTGVRVEYGARTPAPTGKGRPRRRRRTPAKDAVLA